MISVVNSISILLGLGVAPVLFVLSWIYRRRHRQVIQRWRKPQMVVFTIINFVSSLTLFVMGCFFLAIHFGQIRNLEAANLPHTHSLVLGIDCLLLLGASTLIFFAIQNFNTQFITREGILFSHFRWPRLRVEQELLRWSQVRDVYLHSDYPVTAYNLLYLRDQRIQRRKLRVPFYALPRFEQLLEQHLQSSQPYPNVSSSSPFKQDLPQN